MTWKMRTCYNIFTSARPMAAKFNRVVASDDELLATFWYSVNHLVTWDPITNERLYIYNAICPFEHAVTWGYMTLSCPRDAKLERVMVQKKGSPLTMITWHKSHLTNKGRFTSISTRLLVTKLDRLIAYYKGPPRTKPYDYLITWWNVVMWQVKIVMSPNLEIVWTPN